MLICGAHGGGFDAPKRVSKWVKSRKSHAIIAFSLTCYAILSQYLHIYESLLCYTLLRCKTVGLQVFVHFSYHQRQMISNHDFACLCVSSFICTVHKTCHKSLNIFY